MEPKGDRPMWRTLLAFGFIYFVSGPAYLAIRVGVREVPQFLFAAMRALEFPQTGEPTEKVTEVAARIARFYKTALSANPQECLSALPSMLETRCRRARVDSFEERSIGELTRGRKSEGHGKK
ncbi:MAG TPA: hypothetical protein VFU48_16025 [Nitrospira sp.]|nr:hypothetical protein [Nitrospira sp.]